VVSKPEKPVLPKWPADGIPKLIASQFRARRFSIGSGRGLVVKELVGVELVIAQELEDIAVNAVGSRLGDGIHHSATEFAVFGVEAVGDQPEFRDRIQIRDKARAQVSALTDVTAINQERVRRFSLAVHRNITDVVQVSGNWPVLLDGSRSKGHNARLQA